MHGDRENHPLFGLSELRFAKLKTVLPWRHPLKLFKHPVEIRRLIAYRFGDFVHFEVGRQQKLLQRPILSAVK